MPNVYPHYLMNIYGPAAPIPKLSWRVQLLLFISFGVTLYFVGGFLKPVDTALAKKREAYANPTLITIGLVFIFVWLYLDPDPKLTDRKMFIVVFLLAIAAYFMFLTKIMEGAVYR